MTNALILVGFMGAGKTTVGRLLAQRLRWQFVDLDDRIRAREGRSIPEIFRDSGVEHFRRLESECLREMLGSTVTTEDTAGHAETKGPTTRTPLANLKGGESRDAASSLRMIVLALGGGAFVQPDNAAAIREAGIPVVFLDGSPEVLYRRCAPHASERPLLADENQFRQLYESRREGYMAAGVRVDTSALSPGQVADEIVRRLDLPDYS